MSPVLAAAAAMVTIGGLATTSCWAVYRSYPPSCFQRTIRTCIVVALLP